MPEKDSPNMLYIGTYFTSNEEVPMYKCDYMKPGWYSTIVIILPSGKLYSPSLRNIYLYGKDVNGQNKLEHYWSRYATITYKYGYPC